MIKKGASLYYASDKNIFDAINQSKVNNETLQTMFLRRNIVCSKHTEREGLAEFFSRLTHDYLDHQDLSNRLGVVSRREKTTYLDVKSSKINQAVIQKSLDAIKKSLTATGDIVRISTEGNIKTLWIDYTLIDYRRTEFSQLQKRKGSIVISAEGDRYTFRSSKSDYIDKVRDELIIVLSNEIGENLEREEISLFNHPNTKDRNEFIYNLIGGFDKYPRKDVTDVYVFKPQPVLEHSGAEEHHVERVLLKGYGVTQSDILQSLTSARDYHMVKVGWIVRGDSGAGATYEIEAGFSNPNECTGFTYILRSVTDVLEDSTLSKNKRAPNKTEIDNISYLVENKARDLMAKLNQP